MEIAWVLLSEGSEWQQPFCRNIYTESCTENTSANMQATTGDVLMSTETAVLCLGQLDRVVLGHRPCKAAGEEMVDGGQCWSRG